MPDVVLTRYLPVHELMRVSATTCTQARSRIDDDYVSIDFEAGGLDAPPPLSLDPAAPITERIAQAFLIGLDESQAFKARDTLVATMSSADGAARFLAGVAVGIPIGIKDNLAEQVAWTASVVSHMLRGVFDIGEWMLNPLAWAAGLLAIFDPRTPEDYELFVEQFGGTIPRWMTGAFVTTDLLLDTGKAFVPVLLEDEQLREEFLIEGSRAIALLATSSVATRLDEAGKDPTDQGLVVGRVLGELLGLAIVTLALGVVRLPAKIATEAVELGGKVATAFKVAGRGGVEGLKATARMVDRTLAGIIARFRQIVKKALARHPEVDLIDTAPPAVIAPPAAAPPAPPPVTPSPRGKSRQRRKRLHLPTTAAELHQKYSGKVIPHHVGRRVKERYNEIIEITTKSAWERRLAHVSSHHVLEGKYFDRFPNDLKRVGVLDEDGKPLLDSSGAPVRMESADDMSAILVPGESHYGNPSPESWTGDPITRIEDIAVTKPDGSVVIERREVTYRPQDSFPDGLPTLHDLNNFLDDVEQGLPGGRFGSLREVLDWHEYWYTQRFLNPRFDGRTPVSMPLPPPHARMGSNYQGLLRTILGELNRIRTDLGLPVHDASF